VQPVASTQVQQHLACLQLSSLGQHKAMTNMAVCASKCIQSCRNLAQCCQLGLAAVKINAAQLNAAYSGPSMPQLNDTNVLCSQLQQVSMYIITDCHNAVLFDGSRSDHKVRPCTAKLPDSNHRSQITANSYKYVFDWHQL
jgi:hypothetical protein